MNVSKSLLVTAFLVLAAPLAAHADAPSGDFDKTHPASSKETKADRSGNSNYVEVSVSEMTGSKSSAPKTREEVRKEIASAPMFKVDA